MKILFKRMDDCRKRCRRRPSRTVLLCAALLVTAVCFLCNTRAGIWPLTSTIEDDMAGDLISELSRSIHYIQTNPRDWRYCLIRENISTPYFYKTIKHHPNDKFKERDTINLPNLETIVQKSSNAMKRILIYNPPPWWNVSWCQEAMTSCPVTSCSCLHGEKHLPEADGVIIEALNLNTRIPPVKKKDQVWIYIGLEPPAHYRFKNSYKSKEWTTSFNWTMTYRLDSDVIVPYDVLVKDTTPPKKDYSRIVAGKTKHGLIVTSNCHTESKREEYVAVLNKYYPVDTFGKCGPTKEKMKVMVSSPDIQNKYRFYLSFENAYCDDYLTEKVFKIYNRDSNLIPIVRGGANYSNFLPDGTYINTADFRSPKHLADYLHYLENNSTAYKEILRRKDEYVHGGYPNHYLAGMCDVCVKLHNVDMYRNYYSDVNRWIHEGTCHDQHFNRDFKV